MDINQLLRGVYCQCGRTHSCDIKYVYIEKDAAARLEDICRDYSSILVVCDQNTYAAAGDATVGHLKGKRINRVIFSGDEVLIPNEDAVKTVTDALGDTDMIVGIGSGVIQDLCKYVSFLNKLPYVIVATAPSMDGYASNGAAMIMGGMKVTYPAGLPVAIIADISVLAAAPIDMIKSGYGDVVGKYSALNDWKLSRIVNGEYFCDYIYDLTYQQIETTIALADGILRRDQKSIGTLMEALVVIGILMSFALSSRPASGSEHHLSHFFEITGILNESDYFSHGIDVAYSTVITARLRETILKSKFPDTLYRPSESEYAQIMRSIYKSSADGCIELQEKMGRYKNSDARIYLEKEDEIRAALAEMPTSEEIERILSKANLFIEDFYDFYGNEKIENAIFYAKDLKDRYTVLWMYYDFFGGEANVQ